jgi:hypothetical protein
MNSPCNRQKGDGARPVVICAWGTYTSERSTAVVVSPKKYSRRRVDGGFVATAMMSGIFLRELARLKETIATLPDEIGRKANEEIAELARCASSLEPSFEPSRSNS